MREKPLLVNDSWQGDHHIFDLFVRIPVYKTKNNKKYMKEMAVRPVLTAWMDSATGYIVGWAISILPNSDTIAEAFCRACVITVGDIAKGLPKAVITDCGKDYKSKLLDDACSSYSIENWEDPFLNRRFEGDGLFSALSIKVARALPYHPQSKPVERMFRIIEEKYISKLPGWCHNSVKERPDGFARKLSSLLEKKELLTLEEFVARFRDDILPGYHGAPDPPDDAAVLDGMPGWMVAIESMSPLQRYLSLEKAKTPVPDWKTLGILKRHYYPDKDVINHYGVRFQNVCYTDEALSGHVGERVDILCHTFTKPYAPGSITVLLNGKFLCEAFPVQKHKMVGEAPEALQDSDDIQDLAKKEMSQAVQRISRSAHSILPGNMDEQEPSKKDQMREMAYAQMPQEAGNSPSRGGPAVTTPSNGLPETTVSPANLNDAYDALFGAS